jgi:type II pantothenate kinase
MTSWKAQAPAALEVPGVSSSIGDSMPLHMTLSPVDPSFLEGASSLARFGLDIGGTLCKVVFFEPDEAHAGGAPLDKSRLSRTSAGEDFSNGAGSDASEEEASVCKRSRPTPRVFSKSAMSAGQARKMWVSSHDPVHIPGRGTLYFKCFETWKMEEFLALTKEHSLVKKGRALGATGGGARKFKDRFLQIAGLQLERADELHSLVRGIDFLARHAHHESFEYPLGSFRGGAIQRPLKEMCDEEGDQAADSQESTDDVLVLANAANGRLGPRESLYPYLVVNIGSGVSILRVDNAENFERVGGTSLGGSTFLGLAAALTGCTTFEEAINFATEGDSTQIDMLVGDIYGGDYTEMGLAATTVASSFGKLVQPERREAAMKTPHNLVKAALLMVTNNIGSIAMLHARAAGVRQIMFTGSFLHENQLAMRLLAVAMEFWSKGNMKAVFLRHEGHAGAMGALLSTLDPSNAIDNLLLDAS